MLMKGQLSSNCSSIQKVPVSVFCSVELAEWNMYVFAAGFYVSAAVGYYNYIVFHHWVKTMNDMGHI